MSKFVIECPSCGKYAEGRTGFFARKKIDCTCGHTINVRTEKLAARECPHCGNTVIFDQTDGAKAKCPVCGESINTMAEQNKVADFACAQCGVRLRASKAAIKYVCPVCDCENDVQERIMQEQIRSDGLASIIKYEGDADTLIWKHPIEDFNFGSQLIVHESQEAVFFRDGQALDLFGAGRYTLETQQLPLLEKLYKLPTDTEGTFHSEVYYINKISQMAVKWGTPEKVSFIDPLTGSPMSIGARGVLNFRVEDSRRLLLRLVGTGSGLTRQQLLEDGNGNIKSYFRSIIQLAVSTKLAAIITENKLDLLQLDQQKLQLSQIMMPLIQPYFSEYGIKITEFLMEGITLPQRGELGYDALQTIIKLRQTELTKSAIGTETEIKMAEMEAKKRLDILQQQNAAEVEIAHRGVVSQKGETTVLEAQLEGQRKMAETSADVAAERLRMQLEMERKLQTAQIEGEEMRLKGYTQRDVLAADVQKAYAEGIGNMGPAISAGGGSGIMGDLLGLGVGMAAAGTVAPQIGAMFQNMTAQPQAQTPAPAPADGWDCPACGKKSIVSKFCPECGAKKPEPVAPLGWDCPACGHKGITSKFCPECGAKKPEPVAAGWTCPACGKTGITSNFCPECGHKKGE